MLAVDIYERYNPVTDWGALASVVDAVYVKGTDGNGLPPVTPGKYVRAAKDWDILTGLYHFAQRSSGTAWGAVVQADVLTYWVRELGADGLPPALDLENSQSTTWTATQGREYAIAFLNRLHDNGFPYVTLYANKSFLEMINVQDWLPSWCFLWLAEYNVNNGALHTPTYNRTRIDLHQFTSKGRIPGISGDVDVNNIRNASILKGSTDMDLHDAMREFFNGDWPEDVKAQVVGAVLANTFSHALTASTRAGEQLNETRALRAEVRTLTERLDTLLNQGVTLAATGEIVVKPTPPVTG